MPHTKNIREITVGIGNFPVSLFVSYYTLLGINTLTLAKKRQNAKNTEAHEGARSS